MLTADQLDALVDPITELYRLFGDSVINDIARRLAGLDYARPTAAWQVQRLSESGMLYDDILTRLSELTGKSESTLRQMFTRAGVKALRFDDAIYKAAGLNPLPLNLSPAMTQVLRAGLEKTGGLARNLTMTTAVQGQNAFIEAADLAYAQVTSGAFDYNSAIRAAVKQLAADGLTVINYATGRVDNLDVSIRRAVLTGISQTTAQLQLARASEMNQDLIQMSAHGGSRPSHAVWQGKIFSVSGTSREYPPFVESTGYGTPGGYAGINCRHSAYPFFEGISENAYSEAEREGLASKTVTYQGGEMSMYDATQEQRAIERKIRYWKRQEGALKAAGLDAAQETAKVKAWQGKMREFTKETGLMRQPDRERVIFPIQKSISGIPKLSEIQSLPTDKVLTIGEINKGIASNWSKETEGNLTTVLTGKQRQHYLGRHREMIKYEDQLISSVLDPDEVHRNNQDKMMAIFYKKYDDEHFLRAAVLMQKIPGDLKHSVLSYRLATIGEVERGRKKGRMVWSKK